MDPLTVGLFVASAIGTAVSNRNQYRVEAASTRLQTEQARLQAAEQGYERTKAFRQNLSTNLALSGMGVGGVNGFRGVAAQSIGDYFGDMAAIGRQDMFAQITGEANSALNKSRNFANNISNLTSSAMLAKDLGLFNSKKPRQSSLGAQLATRK